MGENPRIRNLGISRPLAVLIAIVCSIIAVASIVIAISIFGVDDVSAPVVLSLVGTMGSVIVSLVAALKASETADTSARTNRIAEAAVSEVVETKRAVQLTASQNAAMQQLLATSMGNLCDRDDCPFSGIAYGGDQKT